MTAVPAWALAVQKLHELGGDVTLQVVTGFDLEWVFDLAMAGSPEAVAVWLALDRCTRGIQDAPRHRRPACVSCGKRVKPTRYAVAVVIATAAPSDAPGVGLPVCEACANSREAIQDKALAALASISGSLSVKRPPQGGSR